VQKLNWPGTRAYTRFRLFIAARAINPPPISANETGSGTAVMSNVPEYVLVMDPPPRILVWIPEGLRSPLFTDVLSCVVKAPFQNDRMPSVVSRVVPWAFSVTDEPPASCVRINGDITPPGSTIEQELPSPGFTVQLTNDPGPTAMRLRGMAPNVMNPANPLVLPRGKEFRSLMVPMELDVILPSPLVTFVGIPAARQLFEAPPSGSQSMAVIVTVTPPPTPEQFAIDNWPMVAAEADGANVAKASMAKLNNPNFNAFCFFNVFLRKVQGHFI
jgi:hypothetical protein